MTDVALECGIVDVVIAEAEGLAGSTDCIKVGLLTKRI